MQPVVPAFSIRCSLSTVTMPVPSVQLMVRILSSSSSGFAEAVDVDDVLVLGGVAADVVIFVGEDFTLRDGHPAELAVVGVDGGLLTGRPADGHDVEEVVAI